MRPIKEHLCIHLINRDPMRYCARPATDKTCFEHAHIIDTGNLGIPTDMCFAPSTHKSTLYEACGIRACTKPGHVAASDLRRRDFTNRIASGEIKEFQRDSPRFVHYKMLDTFANQDAANSLHTGLLDKHIMPIQLTPSRKRVRAEQPPQPPAKKPRRLQQSASDDSDTFEAANALTELRSIAPITSRLVLYHPLPTLEPNF